MPQPDHRPPFKIEDSLIQARVWELIESGQAIRISCDACHHEALWTRDYMRRKLAKWKGATMVRVAWKLRCGGCRSPYVRIWRR